MLHAIARGLTNSTWSRVGVRSFSSQDTSGVTLYDTCGHVCVWGGGTSYGGRTFMEYIAQGDLMLCEICRHTVQTIDWSKGQHRWVVWLVDWCVV